METCSKHCNDLDINSSPPRSCLDASVGASTSCDDDHSDFRCNASPEETSGDFATLSTLSGLPPNDDSGVETPLGEIPQEEDQIVDAICKRTRAHFSLTDMSLDELETFLQESDEEDYFQNVDDEEEYRKFVAAVQGNWQEGLAVDSTDGFKQVEEYDDDEDEEDDYDFEIELEEALESDYEELPKQESLKRKRRHRGGVLGHSLKKRTLVERPLGSARTPLRPILPSIVGRDVSSDPRKLYNEALHGGKEARGFTPCQRRQLQCLMHEHVQLLVQVFSVTVGDSAQQQVAADTHKLLLQLADAREQVLSWKRSFLPEICCCPHNAHLTTSSNLQPLVNSNAFQPRSPNQFITKHLSLQDVSCPARGVPDTKANSDTSPSSNLQKGGSNCTETTTSIPTTRNVTSLLDVAALALVKDFVADVSKGVHALRHQRSQLSDFTDKAPKPLFPASMIQVPPAQNCQRKKTMAGSLVEDTKLNGIILVPPLISSAISRFTALFDPKLFPYKPPPAAVAKRLLFTEAEDELLAMGLMRYNTNWEKIQQLLLPSKTTHQIFVRQKNRSTTKAPENSIKAVRRLKTSPLTKEEEACIEEGLKFFRSDWMKVWEHCVPYRDPTTLSRLWRAAVGLQKSYSEEAKEKHRIGEKLRRQKLALQKEQNDGTIGDLNSGDETCEDTTGAYFHEAFLTDYNSQACSPCAPSDTTTTCEPSTAVQNSLSAVHNLPMPTAPCLPTSKCDYLHSAQSWGSFDTAFKASRRMGKRYRRNTFQVIKLAPGLPSLNLPHCARVISQAKYNREFSAQGKSSLASGPHGSSRNQKGASSSGSACSFSPIPVASPANFTGPSHTPSFHRAEKAIPAEMHPLLMQNTFETGPLSLSMSRKHGSSHKVTPGLSSTHNIPRFRPFLPLSKGKSTVRSMEVLAAQTESSTRSVAELHPFLRDDGDRQDQADWAAKRVMEPKSSVVEAPLGSGANTGTSHLRHSHWPFFLSDSVIRPEPRRAVRVQNAHSDRSASAPTRSNRSHSAANRDDGGSGSKDISKDITGHAGPSKPTEKEIDNSAEEENVVMEQEELSGSEEETEEVVQFDYEEITDSDIEEFGCGENAICPDKGQEGIDFEEEEIGSDDGDSEVGT